MPINPSKRICSHAVAPKKRSPFLREGTDLGTGYLKRTVGLITTASVKFGVIQRRFVAELDLPKVIRVGEVAHCDESENIFNPDISAKQGAPL